MLVSRSARSLRAVSPLWLSLALFLTMNQLMKHVLCEHVNVRRCSSDFLESFMDVQLVILDASKSHYVKHSKQPTQTNKQQQKHLAIASIVAFVSV